MKDIRWPTACWCGTMKPNAALWSSGGTSTLVMWELATLRSLSKYRSGPNIMDKPRKIFNNLSISQVNGGMIMLPEHYQFHQKCSGPELNCVKCKKKPWIWKERCDEKEKARLSVQTSLERQSTTWLHLYQTSHSNDLTNRDCSLSWNNCCR